MSALDTMKQAFLILVPTIVQTGDTVKITQGRTTYTIKNSPTITKAGFTK